MVSALSRLYQTIVFLRIIKKNYKIPKFFYAIVLHVCAKSAEMECMRWGYGQ